MILRLLITQVAERGQMGFLFIAYPVQDIFGLLVFALVREAEIQVESLSFEHHGQIQQ